MAKEGIRIFPVAIERSNQASTEIVAGYENFVSRAHDLKLPGAQYFGGQVYNLVMPDAEEVSTGMWMENASITSEGDGCVPLHYHNGERYLIAHTAPNSVIIVMSTEPIIFDDKVNIAPAQLAWQKDGRYFALVPPNAEYHMRFAPGISHGFIGIGKTHMLAWHPNERGEIALTTADPDLNKQTVLLEKKPIINCASVAENIRMLQNQNGLPELMLEQIKNHLTPRQTSAWARIAASVAAAIGIMFIPSARDQHEQTLAEKYCGADTVTLAVYSEKINGLKYYTFPRPVFELAKKYPLWESFNAHLDQLNIPTPKAETLIPDDAGNDKIWEYNRNPRKIVAFHFIEHDNDRGFNYIAPKWLERNREEAEREFFSLLRQPHIIVDSSDPQLAYNSSPER